MRTSFHLDKEPVVFRPILERKDPPSSRFRVGKWKNLIPYFLVIWKKLILLSWCYASDAVISLVLEDLNIIETSKKSEVSITDHPQ